MIYAVRHEEDLEEETVFYGEIEGVMKYQSDPVIAEVRLYPPPGCA